PFCRAADQGIGRAVHADAVAVVSETGPHQRLVADDADRVSLNNIACRVAALIRARGVVAAAESEITADRDTGEAPISGNDVSEDGVARRAANVNAAVGIPQRRRTVPVGAYVIADDQIRRRMRAVNPDAFAAIGRDEVSISRAVAADRVVRRIEDQNAVAAICTVLQTRDVGADEISGDDVSISLLDADAVASESPDDQSSDRSVAGEDPQAVDTFAGILSGQLHNRRSIT